MLGGLDLQQKEEAVSELGTGLWHRRQMTLNEVVQMSKTLLERSAL